jgi:hypothetical protein
MRAFPSINALIAKWRREGVELNPPADAAAIDRVEREIGVALPDSLRAFCARANGMVDPEMDGGGTACWSVDKVVSEHEVWRGSDARGAFTDWAIADLMIRAHYFSLRLREDAPPTFMVDGFGLEFASFEAMAAAYLADPQQFGA